jgi:hypothetical protein
MASTMTILAGHPYFVLLRPHVWQQSWDRQWTVRWRDFHGMQQSHEFAAEADAVAFAAALRKPPLTVYDEGGAGDLAAQDRFWRDLLAGRL